MFQNLLKYLRKNAIAASSGDISKIYEIRQQISKNTLKKVSLRNIIPITLNNHPFDRYF